MCIGPYILSKNQTFWTQLFLFPGKFTPIKAVEVLHLTLFRGNEWDFHFQNQAAGLSQYFYFLSAFCLLKVILIGLEVLEWSLNKTLKIIHALSPKKI